LLDGTHFRVEAPGSVPIALQSAGVIQLKIMFQPKSRGTLFDTLTITTDDPAQPTITIVLKGKGSQ
jgi:VCBS repeat-containing protein